MRDLDFNMVLDLEALLREGSVVGAAKRLHLSAPAMSRRLANLREAVGDQLFVPAGRGLVPTQRALELREKIDALAEQMRKVFMTDEVDLSTVERTLVLRTNDGFAGAWAARLAQRVAQEAPGITLRFSPRADKHVGVLRDGLVDLEIGALHPGDDDMAEELHNQVLFRTPFVGVVRAGHPLARKKVSLTGFIAWPHIAASRTGSDSGPIDDALAARGMRRKVRLVAPGFQSAVMMAASSDMIAAAPARFARWATEHLDLHVFPLPLATPEVEVSQSWHPRRHADPVHKWVRGLVRDLCSGPD
ncbi:LysR family transcriptional regulator [Herbaspirillum rhizosphaerae]|uniref:LysR family transcriptional regulator n=1 Tax=Herbaspirillum rhizosphaerae TaxID=346179 RepID=UPI00067C5E07|nr:LysR family transcriptional regulator [Herbaspirillum rhizosphaerae]